jgi:tetratricopeptide (TPR) repeat protein
MQASLERAEVDYEQGQTYPLKSTNRNELMSKALKQFELLYQKYRTQMTGLAARMWEGKCYEERGDIGPAMGIYNELLEHNAPQLRPLQRHVGFFKIIALGKRKQYALAADTAVKWLQDVNNTPVAQRQPEVIGVQFEFAKDLIAQLPDATEAEKTAATKKIIDTLGKVVKYSSPYKSEAIELLKKYKPKTAESTLDIARLNYDDAIAMADQAVGSREWDRAAAIYKHAVRKAESVRDVDKMTYARHHLAFCYYKSDHLYEAAVIADHLARRYPRASLAPKTANIGMAALAAAFQAPNQIDGQSDLKNLIELAEYTAETFPDQEEGDNAKLLLGQVYYSTQSFEKAIKAFDSVRPKSQSYVEAQTRAGATHWSMNQAFRRSGKTKEADAEAAKALSTLQGALKLRQDAGDPLTDTALMGNACDIADIFLETSRPAEAVKLLDPIAKAQTSPSGSPYFSLMSHLIRAHVALNQVDLALADMALIEKSGETGSSLTQLYFDLGKLLEKEIEAREAKGDQAGRNRAQQTFQRFLTTLADSKSGQTYQSLRWTGEKMLGLGDAKGAESVFRRVIGTYGSDPKFLGADNASERLMLWKIDLVDALRAQGKDKFAEAQTLVAELIDKYPGYIDPLMEKGKLMESMAEAKRVAWSDVSKEWRSVALRLEKARPRKPQYYEAWYHVALAMNRDGKGKEAKQTLGSIMRLSPKVGGAEMKKKYETLLAQIKS